MKAALPAWKYCSLGGAVRVKVDCGRDLERLSELDQKYWTVLSCPVSDMEFDRETLNLIDSDRDGKIKVGEMLSAARWLCTVIKDKDSIFRGDDVLRLDNIDCTGDEGRRIHDSARRIRESLGLEPDCISLANASDSAAIFKGALFNGDGVIVPECCDDTEGRKAVEACMKTMGSVTDRSGAQGVHAGLVEAFYSSCADYAAWLDTGEAEKDAIFPFGDATAATYEAVESLRSKVDDYFMRCRLLVYDRDAASALSVRAGSIDDLQSCPLARPRENGVLPFGEINPAWQKAFDKVRRLVEDKYPGFRDGMDESVWNGLLAMLEPYAAWMASVKGERVASLGEDAVRSLLAADRKGYLIDVISRDKALEQEAESIDDVRKLMLLYRDYARLLDNYLIFSDFYARPNGQRAVFEAGRLYIDQRCCELCLRVADMAGHSDMAKLSGMFLIYCRCVSKPLGKVMDVVAVMTAGDTSELRPGKNGVFYDCEGHAWDATVTKVVDNPVSIRHAFWSPYRKFWEFCVGLIGKSAADKDSKVMVELQDKVSVAVEGTKNAAPADTSRKQPFDVAKFAGIFAALGLALGYIGSFLTKLAAGIAATPWWQVLLAVAVIVLVISGPSCMIAWSRLRRRNLGPVLNANGWAINSRVLVNSVFGARLTSVAVYPKMRISKSDAHGPSSWWKWLLLAVVLGCLVASCLGILDLGIHRINS